MNKLLFTVGIIFLFGQSLFAQQATEIPVSMKTADGKYVGMVAGGGLDASSDAVTPKQTFTLIDLNGGKVADGDKVKIKYETSQWHEDKDKSLIHRIPIKGANEAECIFKLRVKDKLIYFETPAGKFVSVDNNSIITTSEPQKIAMFDIQAASAPSQPASYTVAFKFANGNHLGMVANGGLDASSAEIGNNQIFTVVDLNGGTLINGDPVKIIFGQSQMREDAGANKIHRVPIRGAKDEECTFKLLVIGKNIAFQTPSGKYLVPSADGKSITTTDKKEEAGLITVVPNPTPTGK